MPTHTRVEYGVHETKKVQDAIPRNPESFGYGSRYGNVNVNKEV